MGFDRPLKKGIFLQAGLCAVFFVLSILICILMVIITFGVIVATVVASGFSEQYEVSVGSVCTSDIYAPRTIVDTVTTNARRQAAKDSVEDVYVIDSSLTDFSVEKVNKALSSIYTAREKAKKQTHGSNE